MKKAMIPLIGFIALVVLLAAGLSLDPKKVPSPLIDKAAPAFTLPRLYEPGKTIGKEDMLGKVWVLNVFASWCVSCRAEHEVVKHLVATGETEVIGLNYKDEGPDAKAWLKHFGNPYHAVAVDYKGNVGIDFGVYGVPESFVVDKKGVIRHKVIGPMNDPMVRETLLPLIRTLKSEA